LAVCGCGRPGLSRLLRAAQGGDLAARLVPAGELLTGAHRGAIPVRKRRCRKSAMRTYNADITCRIALVVPTAGAPPRAPGLQDPGACARGMPPAPAGLVLPWYVLGGRVLCYRVPPAAAS
jgi:hypothetical protein